MTLSPLTFRRVRRATSTRAECVAADVPNGPVPIAAGHERVGARARTHVTEYTMEHLTPLDAAFLDAEDEDRDASLAIASIAILEGPAPDQLAFIKAVSG